MFEAFFVESHCDPFIKAKVPNLSSINGVTVMPRDTTRANGIFGAFFAQQTNLPLYRHELNTHKKSVEDDMARFRYLLDRLSADLKLVNTYREKKLFVGCPGNSFSWER